MAATNGTPEHSVAPDATLCEQCQSYDLQQWFYPRDGRVLGQRAPDDMTHFEATSLAKRDLERCSFCKLLLDSMDLSSELSAIKLNNGLSSMWLSVEKVEYTATNRVNIYPARTVNATSDSDFLLHRRIIQDRLDLDLLTSWLRDCEECHQGTCVLPVRQGRAIAATRLIDVIAQRIVDVAKPVEYFALSYCWGNSQRSQTSLRLTRVNTLELHEGGALADDRDDLPLTIRDAMLLTGKLGRRYLWVDALCICQDDADDKLNQINQMDRIYKDASLTLVAAAGDDSWSGLPGLRSRAKRSHVSGSVQGINLLARPNRPEFRSAIARSGWAARAWTMQEHILSSRLLIFTAEEISWECDRAIWTEGLALENHNPHVKVDLVRATEFASKPAPGLSPLQRYRYLILSVSQRHLSYEEDRLNCMQGMLNVLENDFPGGFIWGLPVAVLDSSLLFANHQSQEAPFARVEHFPSWSWAGWKVQPNYTITSPYDVGFSNRPRNDMDILALLDHSGTRDATWIRKEVAWYCLDDSEMNWRPLDTALINVDGSFFYRSSKNKWEESDPARLFRITKARFFEAGVPYKHALAFWTQSVHLQVDRVKSERKESRGFGTSTSHAGLYTVRNAENRNICYLALTEAYRASQPDKLYFILLAHNRRFEKQYGPLMELMHVETKDAITYRVQGVRDCVIDVGMWKSFKPKWEFFSMA
ncbi:hypothetical protein LTR70_000769 [Exophiala xenobiotica]|uniref:Heterokaryon incompatibility domain-containing protein n=1 Tax=Lithohypha guttulata TaxID=1690604 RepID=A0ABR0KQ93_9EURO|nr:hypothetical protein LTR24_000558 [Lithohypha guttulata]KAK5329272.1 hypothetical protein LTR70_000769 [Exophiala xenobiotica]